jgi:hypothetical protein
MKVHIIEGIAGTYEDGITPLYANPGDVIDISPEWAQRLIDANIAEAVAEEPKKPASVKVK